MDDTTTPARPATLQEEILEDLIAANQPEAVVDLVLAAVQGDDAFADALAGSKPAPAPSRAAGEAAGVYLKSIAVQGFRGIGEQSTLQVRPGPGLTLVIGRNGCGKSSFAEAAEVAITGRSSRWNDKSAVWKSAWQNLHHPTPGIRVDVLAEGAEHPVTVACRWAGDDVTATDVTVKQQGRPDGSLADLGWGPALSKFRPFLSYAELGDAVTGRPSQLHDALYSILGLEDAEAAHVRLKERLKAMNAERKQVNDSAKELAQALAGVDDDRARSAAALLSAGKRDLPALAAIATGAQDAQDPRLQRWHQMAAAPLPSAEHALAAAAELEAAAAALAQARGSADASAARLADLLERAATHMDEHGPGPCPVCGVTALDATWPDRARAEAAAYRGSAQSLAVTKRRLEAARDAVRNVVATAAPAALFQEDFPAAAGALRAWHGIPSAGSDASVAAALLDLAEATAARVLDARTAAAALVQELQDLWQPFAVRLSQWLAPAQKAAQAEPVLPPLRKAEAWFKQELTTLKDHRLAPFKDQSAMVWERLRQESNVALSDIALTGTGPARAVQLDVTVDGMEGNALGVMSQGELHALGLALFIPRATADASPFRFLLIDDPVQAMDPAKVDGLAVVLQEVAKTRQVVVFTHDDRLPESVRRLGIDAIVWEVVRKPQSVVEIRKNSDPVQRYLEDARALAADQKIPAAIRGPVIAGFLRSAIEAQAQDVIRRKRLGKGERRAEVEAAIEAATTTNTLLAMALFDDAGQGGNVLPRLNRWGPALADAYQHCRAGVHGSDFADRTVADFNKDIESVKDIAQRVNHA